MKWLSIACLTAFAVSGQGLADVKAVYVLPMSRGLDQFLAERLTSQGVLQVVTDPHKADFVLSDRIGAGLNDSLSELYAPKGPELEKRDESVYSRPASQPSSRGKGNLFLVDRRSAEVLWSMFLEPGSADPNSMSHAANQAANKLSKNLADARKKK